MLFGGAQSGGLYVTIAQASARGQDQGTWWGWVGEGAGGSHVGEGPSLCGTHGPESSQVYVFPKLMLWKRPTREELNAVWRSLR